MKILWVTHNPNKIYVNILKALHKVQPTWKLVMTASDDWHKKEEFLSDAYSIAYLPRTLSQWMFLPAIWHNKLLGRSNADMPALIYYKGLEKLLKKEQPDLVIINTFFRGYSWDAAQYCITHKIPYVVQTEIKKFPANKFMASVTRFVLWKYAWFFRYAKMILPWTSDALAFARKHISHNQISLLPAGIDMSIFKPYKRVTHKHTEFIIIARAVPFKRYQDLLAGFKLALQKTKNIRLSIRAGGPLQEEIEKMSDDMGLSKYVTFLDRISNKDLPKLLAKYDVSVLTSENEAIGMVIPEAMACGLPVIISDTCGCKTYVTHGKNGFIFTTKDVHDLAKYIVKMDNASLRKKMGVHAHKIIKEKFEILHIGRMYADMAKQLVK